MALDPNGKYYMYLRKSREDVEAEAHGEGETLARHENRLKELAVHLGINISKIYREIVSGETIAARPEMMRLLTDIENDQPDGILVVELERLARGDTRDQGLIMETFKYGNTKIITPMKTFDPNNEFDEEYAEFGLFMSRREYKTICRRLRDGKYNTAKEGKWPWGKAPYGYERYKLKGQKGYSLKIVPEEAETVRLIYTMYTIGTPETNNKPISATAIGKALDKLLIKPRYSETWAHNVIRDILLNHTYIGEIPAGKRKIVKIMVNGNVKNSTPVNKDCDYFPALHEPIIDKEIFDLAQKVFNSRSKAPIWLNGTIKNPLAGLLKCQQCGYTMIRRPISGRIKQELFLCKKCDMPGAAAEDVMEKLLIALKEWLADYRISISTSQLTVIGTAVTQAKINETISCIDKCQKRLDKAYEAFETGIYDADTLKDRAEKIKHELNLSQNALNDLLEQQKSQEEFKTRRQLLIPKVEFLLDNYNNLTPEEQNILLKEVLEKIEYSKEKRGTKKEIPEFHLKIYPKI